MGRLPPGKQPFRMRISAIPFSYLNASRFSHFCFHTNQRKLTSSIFYSFFAIIWFGFFLSCCRIISHYKWDNFFFPSPVKMRLYIKENEKKIHEIKKEHTETRIYIMYLAKTSFKVKLKFDVEDSARANNHFQTVSSSFQIRSIWYFSIQFQLQKPSITLMYIHVNDKSWCCLARFCQLPTYLDGIYERLDKSLRFGII